MHPQQLRSMRQELEKVANPLEALMGPLGHFLVNAGGRSAHHNTNIAEVMAHKGFQHGAVGQEINPIMHRSLKLLAGPESSATYATAHNLGKRIYAMEPTERAALLKKITEGGVPPDMHSLLGPVTGPILQAVHHDVAGTAPKLTGKAIGAAHSELDAVNTVGGRMYSGLVDRMSNVVNSPFDTTLQRTAKNVVGAIPAGGLLAAEPVGTTAHYAINGVRDFLGNSSVGDDFLKREFHRGVHGERMSPLWDKVTDFAVSPAVMDPRREGLAAHAAINAPLTATKRVALPGGYEAHGTIAAPNGARPLIQRGLPAAETAIEALPVAMPKLRPHQEMARDAAGFTKEMLGPVPAAPTIPAMAKQLVTRDLLGVKPGQTLRDRASEVNPFKPFSFGKLRAATSDVLDNGISAQVL